ncbi:MarR family winged helix-turn-helix transcriptional regulator [Blastococcus sp. SYSU DS1024]
MSSLARPGATDPAGGRPQVELLSEQMPRFMRLAQALKNQALKNQVPAPENRDRAALVLLFPLVRQGPLRQGALAELVHADPSTISRHVAALVEQGLVRRVADESDGRASRLVVTDAGRAALDALHSERTAHLARVTAHWDEADLATLTTLFGRLLDDIAADLPGAAESAAAPSTHPAGENR